MVFVTGDTHGDVRRFNTEIFPEQYEMTKSDTVIICGDFGLVWNYKEESPKEKYWLDWLDKKPFTTVFVDGNHECHPRFSDYPVREWNGGKVHEIRPSVLHLIRGEVYEIEGKKFFAFGGASSHDISDGIIDGFDENGNELNWRQTAKEMDKMYKFMYRVKGISWWQEELPTEEEMENGIKNLKENNFEVDYVISHCLPTFVQSVFSSGLYEGDYLTDYFQSLCYDYGLEYSHWLCGHYHINRNVLDRFGILYEQIVRIL